MHTFKLHIPHDVYLLKCRLYVAFNPVIGGLTILIWRIFPKTMEILVNLLKSIQVQVKVSVKLDDLDLTENQI